MSSIVGAKRKLGEVSSNRDRCELFDLDYVRETRFRELQVGRQFFPSSGRLLEVGAGAGWQAKQLTELGYEVNAIDVQECRYQGAERVFSVETYNGTTLPFQDNTFDIVFSSHVLEHIPHIDELLLEMKRVLKPGGIAVHIMPSSTWRMVATLTHYPVIVKLGFQLLASRLAGRRATVLGRDYPVSTKVKKALWPNRHGERGNFLSEAYYFSRNWWRSTFEKGSWNITSVEPTGCFMSGHSILGQRISFDLRNQLSSLLGSTSVVYVAKPADDGI